MKERQTPASTLSKAQQANMPPVLMYPFSALVTQQISLTGFKYELLACVRKLESQSDFDEMMAQLDILQKKNKITEADYQSCRAIVLGHSADDTYFQPPQYKANPTDFRQEIDSKPTFVHSKKTIDATPEHPQSSMDHHATLFYTQKKSSPKKNISECAPQKEILLAAKKPRVDLRVLSAIIALILLLLGEFFYLSWQKKQSTTPSAIVQSTVISNTDRSNADRPTVTPSTTIENTVYETLSLDQNSSLEQLWEKLQYSIDQQYLEPTNTEGSAHFIFNQMLEKEPNHPLIQRARIQLASAYLNLSKQARETNDWNRAEHYSQQAILVRNPEIFLPSEKK